MIPNHQNECDILVSNLTKGARQSYVKRVKVNKDVHVKVINIEDLEIEDLEYENEFSEYYLDERSSGYINLPGILFDNLLILGNELYLQGLYDCAILTSRDTSYFKNVEPKYRLFNDCRNHLVLDRSINIDSLLSPHFAEI